MRASVPHRSLLILLLLMLGAGAFGTGTAHGLGAASPAPAPPHVARPSMPSATPPSAPLDLLAHPENRAVNLTWVPPTSDGGAVLTGYVIEFTPLGTGSGTLTVGPTNHTWVAGLQNGVTYTFDVAGRNRVGDGPNATAQAVPGGVPSAPGNLTVVPGNESGTFRWSAPVPVVNYPVLAYLLTLSSGGKVDQYSFATTTGRVSGLVDGLAYRATVQAENYFGVGGNSTGITFTPYGPPAAPASVHATYNGQRGAVVVSWIAPPWTGGAPVQNYTIQWTASNGSSGTAQVGPSVTSWSLTRAGLGERYTVSVAATTRGGRGSAAEVSYTVPPFGPPLTASSPLLVLAELLLTIGAVFVVLHVMDRVGRWRGRSTPTPRVTDEQAPSPEDLSAPTDDVRSGAAPQGWGPPGGGG